MSLWLLKGEGKPEQKSPPKFGLLLFFSRLGSLIESAFEKIRVRYAALLAYMLEHRIKAVLGFLLFYAISFCLLPQIGEEYFPAIDAGQLRLHVSCSPGLRLEETERVFKSIESHIKDAIPEDEIEMISDNIGMPVNPINYAYSDSQTVSEADGEILVGLKESRSHSTLEYQTRLRKMLKEKFPDLTFYFQPADIITRILNAGLPAPINVRVLSMQRNKIYPIAQDIKRELSQIPGAVDVCLHQVVNAPHIEWTVDRVRAGQLGITQNDVSNSFLVSLSSSFQTSPNFFLNEKTGINYNLAAQTPQYRLSNLDQVSSIGVMPSMSTALSGDPLPQPELLTNIAGFKRSVTPAVANHVNVLPVFDVYASCQGRDLGSVSRDVQKLVAKHAKILEDEAKAKHHEVTKKKGRVHAVEGVFMFLGGQVLSMIQAYAALIFGLIFAVVLVYLLLVVNFQSWTDPLIILMAIPGAFSGILWSLFVCQTPFSIPALMGTIMTVGVASANSILMVTYAKERFSAGDDQWLAALNAGRMRFRPVIMTATAMIIGMIPMAIGGGEGGSQNAPIGRAVIGGLTVATLSTLFFVPLIFSLTRKWALAKGGLNVDR